MIDLDRIQHKQDQMKRKRNNTSATALLTRINKKEVHDIEAIVKTRLITTNHISMSENQICAKSWRAHSWLYLLQQAVGGDPSDQIESDLLMHHNIW